jgi:hypothetical protein
LHEARDLPRRGATRRAAGPTPPSIECPDYKKVFDHDDVAAAEGMSPKSECSITDNTPDPACRARELWR